MDTLGNFLKTRGPLVIQAQGRQGPAVRERYGSRFFSPPTVETKSGELPFVLLGDEPPSYSSSGGADDAMSNFLENQKVHVIEEVSGARESFDGELIIPPLNTDVRFSNFLSYHSPSQHEREGVSMTHPLTLVREDFKETQKQVLIPPLNTDIRFDNLPYHNPVQFGGDDGKRYKPWEHKHQYEDHPGGLHVHDTIHENFSWAVPTKHDTPLDLVKKSIIQTVPSQHACGSCWAVCIAGTMSDCLVVSGAVGWAPNISPTFLMSSVPSGRVHNMCLGGNPAAVVPFLERDGVADTSCIDYSWCSGDNQLCKSVSSARHFDAKTLAGKLNDNIPKPAGCYYGNVKKWLYKLDPGSDVFYISPSVKIDEFRNTVRSHILDYGPVIGGYVVLNNFFTGNFTNPNLNGGVYFDRADYDNHRGGKLRFDDKITQQAAGLHAVSIVGFGVAKNIQYDNDKYGDVPYWHCRNSWGTKWGQEGGYFKIAMYPFNQVAQFDKQVMTQIGGPVGSMILVRATKRPIQTTQKQIPPNYLKSINRMGPNAYYEADADQVRLINRERLVDIDEFEDAERPPAALGGVFEDPYTFSIIVLGIVVIVTIILMQRSRV